MVLPSRALRMMLNMYAKKQKTYKREKESKTCGRTEMTGEGVIM
jgi:hypothetical protein